MLVTYVTDYRTFALTVMLVACGVVVLGACGGEPSQRPSDAVCTSAFAGNYRLQRFELRPGELDEFREILEESRETLEAAGIHDIEPPEQVVGKMRANLEDVAKHDGRLRLLSNGAAWLSMGGTDVAAGRWCCLGEYALFTLEVTAPVLPDGRATPSQVLGASYTYLATLREKRLEAKGLCNGVLLEFVPTER